MNFDFSQENFFDNHTHVLDMDKFHVTEEEFLRYYCHGPKYLKGEGGIPIPSPKALSCLREQGVIHMLVHYLSQKFHCEESLEAVIACRNESIKDKAHLEAYIKSLYDEEHITASILESELPMNDPLAACIPGWIFRLFRYEDVYFQLLKTEDSYHSLITKLKDRIEGAFREGFVGLKGHIAENCGMNIYFVDAQEAEKNFAQAKEGDVQAKRAVYYAMFSEILDLCGEFHASVHIHTGSTGMGKNNGVYQYDPILMVPFLGKGRYEKTDIVLLHGSYPFTRHAAMLAFNFSNIYVDMSQTLPWESLGMKTMFEEVIALAPHNRIIMGSGQHGCPETAWLAAKTAKAALEKVMEDITEQGMMSGEQARRSAKMILSENALKLYGVQGEEFKKI